MDEHTASIPIHEFPVPVISYTVEGGKPRITKTNDSFEGVFESISVGTPVQRIFERFSVVNSTGEEDPRTHINSGDCVDIYLDGLGEDGPFFAQIIPTGEDTGYLLFSDIGKCLDIAETPAIDQVSSVISHDLRNPLDVAKAHLRAARETGDAEHFDAVASAHKRMEQIIQDVLTITRDRTAVDPTDHISIETAAKDAWESVNSEDATLEISDTLPTAKVDIDRIQRLFENLYRNAIDHGSDKEDQTGKQEQAGNGERGVTITVGALEDGFYVADDGPGISPGEQNKVFDPGYSTRDDGTGLGLPIVDRIVAAHGWELTLTTAMSGGARFEIRF
jgi:signal transduction histidine kinase